MTYQIILTALFYLLLAGLLGILVFIWRENIASNKREREAQARLVESIVQSITVSERSVKAAEETAVSIKQAVVVMQHLTESERHSGETTYE